MKQKGKTRLDDLLRAALLGGKPISKAAREAGVSTRTAQRRLADTDFQEKFRVAKLRVVRETTARLTANSGKAADVLKKVFSDRNATSGARVAAATNTIRLTLEAFEVEELEERIRRLEESQKNAQRF